MALRTQLFQQLPWIGGLNTSLDAAMIPPNQLTVADHLVFSTRGSRKKRDGIKYNWDNVSSGTDKIIGLHDFWFGSTTRSQRIVGVDSARAIRSYNGGTATTLTDAGTAWSGTLTSCSMVTFNNLVIIAVDGSSNVIKKWSGSGNVADLDGTPPAASILRTHLGRIWCNDKTNPDRLHFCETSDHTKWGGVGDSGALDIGIGDGDPVGITAIFPSFKGDLFVAKKTKLYRITGYTPETFQVSLVSSGVGCVSHNSIAQVDESDMFFVSERGIHSLAATANYGDFEASFVSADIQKTFNDDWSKSRLPYIWAAYLPSLNSVAFAVTETSTYSRSLTTTSVNNTVYLYNVPLKSWYRWPDVPCSALIAANDSDKKRFYLGTHTTRVAKTLNGTNYDISAAGANTAIRFRVSTGQLSLDDNPYTTKGVKRLALYYRATGTYNITATLRIDNLGLAAENSLSFSETTSGDLLGSTFVLGSSVLGSSSVFAPYVRHVDGYGRTAQLTIEQNAIDQDVEIQGFAIEYEPAGTKSETLLS